jgi:hypothetical protein
MGIDVTEKLSAMEGAKVCNVSTAIVQVVLRLKSIAPCLSTESPTAMRSAAGRQSRFYFLPVSVAVYSLVAYQDDPDMLSIQL